MQLRRVHLDAPFLQVNRCFTLLAFSQPNPRAAYVIEGARWETGGFKSSRGQAWGKRKTESGKGPRGKTIK